MEDTILLGDPGGSGEVSGYPGYKQPEVSHTIALVVVLQLPQKAVTSGVEYPPDVPLLVVVVKYIGPFPDWLATEGTQAPLGLEKGLPVDLYLGVG